MGKYFYDLHEVIFTFCGGANAISKEFNLATFWLGMIAAALWFFFAYLLDAGNEK